MAPQAAQAHVSRESQQLIHEGVTRCVTGVKVQEELLKIGTGYKEWYGERNMVDLQR